MKVPLGARLVAGLCLVLAGALYALYPVVLAGSGVLVYRAVVDLRWLVTGMGGVFRLWGFFFYLAFVFASLAVLLAFLKPLFARSIKHREPYYVDPREAPGLYRLVGEVAAAIRAPVPRCIYVTCDVNASASFRRGLRSFLGDDLTLTVGLPLAGALTDRELAGVIAHELGHFTQRTGMRVGYLLRHSVEYMRRVVTHRDSWDEYVSQLAEGAMVGVMLIAWIVGLVVFLTRCVLIALGSLVYLIVSVHARHAEFDADTYEIRVAGTRAFQRTTVKFACMGRMELLVFKRLRDHLHRGRFLEDIPGGILDRFASLGEDEIRAIKSDMMRESYGVFASHPAPAARLAAAKAQSERGLWHGAERPASELFSNFQVLCKVVTMVQYDKIFGVHPEDDELVPVGEFFEKAPEYVEAPVLDIPEGDIPLV